MKERQEKAIEVKAGTDFLDAIVDARCVSRVHAYALLTSYLRAQCVGTAFKISRCGRKSRGVLKTGSLNTQSAHPCDARFRHVRLMFD